MKKCIKAIYIKYLFKNIVVSIKNFLKKLIKFYKER